MAASCSGTFPLRLNGAPITTVVSTDNFQTTKGKTVLTFTSASIANNQTISIKWTETPEIFTFKTSPDPASAVELPIPSALNTTYCNALADKLRSNDRIAQAFKVTCVMSASNMVLTLESWNFDPITFVTTTNVTGLTFANTNTTGPFTKPNLSALLTINDATTDAELLRLFQPYKVEDNAARSVFDIRTAFNLKPFITDDLGVNFGVAAGSFQPYYLRFADRYGTPPLAESLGKTNTSYALYGKEPEGLSANQYDYYTLHYSLEPFDARAVKSTITHTQAAWIYFFKLGGTSETLRPNVKLIFANGTQTDYIRNFDIEVEPNKTYFVRTDWDFLQVKTTCQNLNLDYNLITEIEVSLKTVTTPTERVKRIFRMNPQGCNGVQLAFTNAWGGIETLAMYPRHLQKVEAEREYFEVEGTFVQSIQRSEARKIWEFKTPLLPIAEAERAAQLIVGDVWLLNRERNLITPIIADTKSVEIKPYRGALAELVLQFKSSKIYQSL